jgi:hypothetical protein
VIKIWVQSLSHGSGSLDDLKRPVGTSAALVASTTRRSIATQAGGSGSIPNDRSISETGKVRSNKAVGEEDLGSEPFTG